MAIQTHDGAQTAGRGRDELLATKLFVPRAPAAFVERTRLREQLDEGRNRGLIVVSAPAGSGKSSLLAEWVRASDTPTAWLSIDESDNDPSRFWRHLVAALEPIRPSATASLSDVVSASTTPSPDIVATRLINVIAASPEQAVLVLDDYDRVEDEAIGASVLKLVEGRPPGLCIVLAGRADPLLPLARLRARGQLAELRVTDLRFTTDESRALLSRATGDEIPERIVETLTERTEGWAAGITLAGLSMRGHTDMHAFVDSFSGSHRYVLDYLAEEVLERQDPEVRRFLLETSILGRLSAPLCDAVTNHPGTQAFLEQLERENLFIIPLDDVRGWWRYHHLFADLLRDRLALEMPGRASELHAAAARWYLAEGLGDAAFHHALASGDTLMAARVVEAHFDEAFLVGERVTIERWLDALPAQVVHSRPRLSLARAFMALAGGQLGEIAAPLRDAEQAATGAEEEPFTPMLGSEASWLANVPAGIRLGQAMIAYLDGDADAAEGNANAVLEMLDRGQDWMLASLARWDLAMADRLRGDLADAERRLRACAEEWLAAGQAGLAAVSNHHLGDVLREQGRLGDAVQSYESMLALEEAGLASGVRTGVAHLGLAEIAYERNELESAQEHLTLGIELCRLLNYTQPLANGLAVLAMLRLTTGNVAGAHAAIEEARAAAPDSSIATVLNPVPVRRARLHLVLGQLDQALAWADARRLEPDATPPYAREPEYVMLARILTAAGQPDRAMPLLDRLATRAEGQGRIGCLIEIRVVQALAQAEAFAALDSALSLGADEGWTRIFLDEGAPMVELLARFVADHSGGAGRAVSHARTLLAAAGARQPGAVAIPGSVEVLTPREVDVLELVAAGHSNQAIAEELFVTLDTVKKHLTHILGKLDAANRTEAAIRARELGLLSSPSRASRLS